MREDSWKYRLVAIIGKILWTTAIVYCSINGWFLDLQLTEKAKTVFVIFGLIYAIAEIAYIIYLIIGTDWPKPKPKEIPVDDADEKVRQFLEKYRPVNVDKYIKHLTGDDEIIEEDEAEEETLEE